MAEAHATLLTVIEVTDEVITFLLGRVRHTISKHLEKLVEERHDEDDDHRPNESCLANHTTKNKPINDFKIRFFCRVLCAMCVTPRFCVRPCAHTMFQTASNLSVQLFRITDNFVTLFAENWTFSKQQMQL